MNQPLIPITDQPVVSQLVYANRLALAMLSGNRQEADQVVEEAFSAGIDEKGFRSQILDVAMERVDDYLGAMISGQPVEGLA